MEMRNVILGTAAGLAFGTLGALAYSHYLGDGSLLAGLQSQLDAATADLAKLKTDRQQLSKETSGVSDQVDQLEASNADLRKQLDEVKSAPPSTNAAPLNPATLTGMLMGMMRGGGGPFQAQQRLFVMQSRLKLTAEQSATIKAALDADQKARRDLMRQRFQNGGKVDPAAAAAANTLDKTLATVLSPDQQTAYQQLQTDEKASRAEIAATSQIDGMMPLLQLSDSQKEAAMEALYQIQVSAPDPNNLVTDPNAMTALATQAQSTQAALAKVLNQDQLALYQQQAQQQAQAVSAFGRGRGGNGGANNGGGTPAAGGQVAGGGGVVTQTGYATPATPASTAITTPAAVTNSPDASATNSGTASATNSATTNAPPQ
jgi:hypothetical protein